MSGAIVLGATYVLVGCDRPRENPVAPPSQPLTTSSIRSDAAPTTPNTAADRSAPVKPDESTRDRGRQEADSKGGLSKEEESKSMPLAGQVNNHSSSGDTTTRAPGPSK
jgi:hypothetical protein